RRAVLMDQLYEADRRVHGSLIASDEDIAVSQALQVELEGIDSRLKELDVTADNAETTLAKMKSQIEASTPAMRELYNESLREIDELEKGAKEADNLANRYSELTSQTKLTKDQSDELTTVVRKLTDRYPELHTEMDEQGRLLIVNESL